MIPSIFPFCNVIKCGSGFERFVLALPNMPGGGSVHADTTRLIWLRIRWAVACVASLTSCPNVTPFGYGGCMNKREHFSPMPPLLAAIFGLQGQEIETWRHAAGEFCPTGTWEDWRKMERQRERVCLSKTHQHVRFFHIVQTVIY